MTKPNPEHMPKALEAIVDVVLAYKPKQAKAKISKKRKKKSSIGEPQKKPKN